MTTENEIDPFSAEADNIIVEGVNLAKQALEQVNQDRDMQPERLAKARADAETARDWALIEEPWHAQCAPVPACDREGRPSGLITVVNSTAAQVFGARLLFDTLDAGPDDDEIDAVIGRYLGMVGGDGAMMSTLLMTALRTAAEIVVPMLLDDIEAYGSNYEARVLLAEARVKAWSRRIVTLRAEQAGQGDDPTDADGDGR